MRVYTASGIAKFRPGHPGQSKFRSPWYEGPGEPIHHRVITYYDHPIITYAEVHASIDNDATAGRVVRIEVTYHAHGSRLS